MRRMLMTIAALCWAGAAKAEGEAAGDFDYYVLSLSWSSGWCALEGDARNDPRCDAGSGLTFVLHGLWPQYEDGWPSYCRTVERDPTRAMTAAMADIMGEDGPAFYQWKKHGRCSGLPPDEFFDLARKAYDSIAIPEVFADIDRPLTLSANVIEDAFLEKNRGLASDQITITCKDGLIQEARICLTPDLMPRRCGQDVIRDCPLMDAVLEPVR